MISLTSSHPKRRRPREIDDDEALVPSWRLREVNAEKRALIAKLDAVKAERDRLLEERRRPLVYPLKQAAGKINVSRDHLRRLVAAGEIKATLIGIRRLGFADEELRRFLAAREVVR